LLARVAFAVGDGEVARLTESPITEHIIAATTIHLLLLFDSNRRTVGRRARLAIGTEADQSGEDTGGGSGAAPAPPELPAIDCSDVAPAGRPARVSWGLVDSYSFMMPLLLLNNYAESAGRSCEIPEGRLGSERDYPEPSCFD
jgi:hypothetical protein